MKFIKKTWENDKTELNEKRRKYVSVIMWWIVLRKSDWSGAAYKDEAC